MYKSFLISALFSLFLVSSGLVEKSSRRYDPLPNCTEAMKQNETAAKLAKCPTVSRGNNLGDTADCCQFWRGFNCEKDILYTLPQCQSSRFLIEMQINLAKPVGTCVKPPSSCANVTNNKAITIVAENIFRPFELVENPTFADCTDAIKNGIINCVTHFDGLLGSGTHPDAAICCDELNFKDCVKNVTGSAASCLVVKTELESIYTMMEKNVAKKCPTMGPHC